MRRSLTLTLVALSLASITTLSLVACVFDRLHDGAARDLDTMRKRGTLRILYAPPTESVALPRHGAPDDVELELAVAFAHKLGLVPLRVPVTMRDQLIPALLDGRGDVIAVGLTATDERKRRMAFTVPTDIVREQVVSRASDHGLHDAADLTGRQVAVRMSSSYYRTIADLRERFPGIGIEPVPEHFDSAEVMHRVANGVYDVTVVDSPRVEAAMQYRSDIRPAFDVTGDRPIAWAVRPSSVELLKELDAFLTASRLSDQGVRVAHDDLDNILERKVLRVLTRNSAASYFLWRGRLMGFEYDLAREFARAQGLRLEMVVPPPGEDLLEWLRRGRGDLVAAAMTPSAKRRKGGVAFSRPYNHVSHLVVTRAGDREITAYEDLARRTFWVRRSSSYWTALERLRAAGIPVRVKAAPEELSTEEIIARVGDGTYDMTLADSHIVAIELGWRDTIRASFAIGDDVPLTWAVREGNPQLLDAVDRFFDDTVRSEFYNVKLHQYFKNPARIRAHATHRTSHTGGLSPYDDTVKHYAETFGFDWRLIVAQMYQESRFDPQAESFAGARGLMQLLPRTALDFGFDGNLYDPETAIHAGVKYMDWVRDRFDPELAVTDRMWFTLAGYNAGAGHVRDARRLADELGLNPNRWFGNVEQAMLLLSRKQYFENSQYGYCRCGEAVHYVREIRDRYRAYVETTGNLNAALD